MVIQFALNRAAGNQNPHADKPAGSADQHILILDVHATENRLIFAAADRILITMQQFFNPKVHALRICCAVDIIKPGVLCCIIHLERHFDFFLQKM